MNIKVGVIITCSIKKNWSDLGGHVVGELGLDSFKDPILNFVQRKFYLHQGQVREMKEIQQGL